MSTKMICDYCLREITANYTRMSIQTINVDGTTGETASGDFEYHPRCYNALQGLVVQLRSQQEATPLDPTPPPPDQQPTNPSDPEPIVTFPTEPESAPEPTPTDPAPAPAPEPDPAPEPAPEPAPAPTRTPST